MDSITHVIVDVSGALFNAALELVLWSFVDGWLFIGAAVILLVNPLIGRTQTPHKMVTGLALLILGGALIWWSHGGAFKIPERGFNQVMMYIRSG